MSTERVDFGGRLVILGFGSIGQGVLPLIFRHIDIRPQQITIVTAEDRGIRESEEFGIKFVKEPLYRENYRQVLEPLLGEGDFLLNVAVEVASTALIELCQQRGALYLDTCVEPWAGGYTDPRLTPSQRSNYGLRESALTFRRALPDGPTAVLTHGANPGLVSHLLKQAMLNMAVDAGMKVGEPQSRSEWGWLAKELGIKVIHVAERDTQYPVRPKEPGEFVNTWSIEGFVNEGSQPAELGWGTHEKYFPSDASRHEFGSDAAIYLNRPGAATRVRSWTPLEGPYMGYLITHGESVSIPDYYSVRDSAGQVVYRPTVHYAYHPCDSAVLSLHELAGKNWILQDRRRLVTDEIETGIDELGVLLMGNPKGVYWYGSRLGVDEARRLAPYNNATSLQVTAPVLAGVIWALENPRRGVVEPDEMDFRRILDICRPYLGEVVGVWGDWTPLQDRERLFPEDLDKSDPWQFKNIRVV